MNRFRFYIISLAVIVGIVWFFGYPTIAQSQTRSWRLNTQVSVIDTTGVCLYVAVVGYGIGIAAVPKTQLPTGSGCQ